MDPHRAYKEAGVDRKAAERIAMFFTSHLPYYGRLPQDFFCQLFPLPEGNLLAATVDGVGTKTVLARECHYLLGLAQDLLAMVYNDLITSGLTPAFWLDYYGGASLHEEQILKIGREMIRLSEEFRFPLLGGETAELPGVYFPSCFELVGFGAALGREERLFTPHKIVPGDWVVGIPSSGFHANGFSLVRKVLREKKISLEKQYCFQGRKAPLGEHLLTPTKVYQEVLGLPWKGLAHITGGGIVANLKRLLPPHTSVEWRKDLWDSPSCEIFRWFQRVSQLDGQTMVHTFNCGYGMIGVCPPEKGEEILRRFPYWKLLGFVQEGKGEVPSFV